MNRQIGDLLHEISAHVAEVDLAERAWAGAEARRARRRGRAVALVAAAAALLIASSLYLASAHRGGPALPSAPSHSTTAPIVRLLPDGTPYVAVPAPGALASLGWRDVGLPEVIDTAGALTPWRQLGDIAGWEDTPTAAFLRRVGGARLTPVLVSRKGTLTVIDDVTLTALHDSTGAEVSPLGARAFSQYGTRLALAQPGKVVVVEGRGPGASVREVPVPATDLQSVGWVSSGESEKVMIARSATRAWRLEQASNGTTYTVTAIAATAYDGERRFERSSGAGVLRRFSQGGEPGQATTAPNPLSSYTMDTVGNGPMVAVAGGIDDAHTTGLAAHLSSQGILAADLTDGGRPALAVLAVDPLWREGCCQVLGWADRTTVLFLVPSGTGPWLLAWDVASGQVQRASRLLTTDGMTAGLALDTGQRR